jgi:diphthine-ammonia ligase
MKAISLISGGKDSFLSLLTALSIGMDVEKTITVKAELDSMMFHYPNAELGRAVSSMMGIDNSLIGESEFNDIISVYGGYFLVAGAVESEFQKTRLEELCVRFGLIPFFPLWRRNQESIIREFISTGSRAIFVSVAAEGLGVEFLGRVLDDESLSDLIEANRRNGISIIGEGGEYETLVTCYPQTGKCIKILDSEVVDRGIQKNLIIRRYEITQS